MRALRHREAISAARAEAAREAIRTVRLRSYPFGLFIGRAWELRDNLSVYDGWYVALADGSACRLSPRSGASSARPARSASCGT